MRKQTKLVAVLSAAALLALGASMTSFAAGWEKDEDGIWHYYDSDVEDDEDDDPEDGGEHWYYFGSKGKKVVDDDKKINGKTYFFNEDGEMQYGWHESDNGEEAYYLGEEDEGWRAESQWLWLEKSGLNEDDLDDDEDLEVVLRCCTSGSITIPESLRARTLSWMVTSVQVRQKQLPTPTESRLYPLSYTMKR